MNAVARLQAPDGVVYDILSEGHPDARLAVFQWTEHNYSCDCNRMLFIREQRQWPEDFEGGEDGDVRDDPCGETIKLLSLKDADTGEILWAL